VDMPTGGAALKDASELDPSSCTCQTKDMVPVNRQAVLGVHDSVPTGVCRHKLCVRVDIEHAWSTPVCVSGGWGWGVRWGV
jgi:hypothetical protein